MGNGASTRARREVRVVPHADLATAIAPRQLSTAEQADLVAMVAAKLQARGIEPAAVVVNGSSTSIILPHGAVHPVSLPIEYIPATANPSTQALPTRTALKRNNTISKQQAYAAAPETASTLHHHVAPTEVAVPDANPPLAELSTFDNPLAEASSTGGFRLPASSAFKYEVFVSHCKRTEASEDRAIWACDVAEGDGMTVFFDRSDLTEISKVELQRAVAASRVRACRRARSLSHPYSHLCSLLPPLPLLSIRPYSLTHTALPPPRTLSLSNAKVIVTVLDPYTFDSEWVCLENQWAREAGRPVVALYDGDRFRWEQLCKWREDGALEHVFKRPVINYQKDYRVESKKRLIGAIREAAAAAPKAVVPLHSLSSAEEAPTLSPTKMAVSHGSMVRIAVGKSTHADASHAVGIAWRHLLSKLGGVTPHLVVAAYTGKHDGAAIATGLASVVSEGCRVVGVSAGQGILFEDQWLSGSSAVALSLWGIFDPMGAYEVAYSGSGLVDDVKTSVKRALEPQVTRGRPRLTLAYNTPTFERSSIDGIQQVPALRGRPEPKTSPNEPPNESTMRAPNKIPCEPRPGCLLCD